MGGIFVMTILWSSIVYNPIAHAIWQSNGWLYKLGDLDFAGGGELHWTLLYESTANPL